MAYSRLVEPVCYKGGQIAIYHNVGLIGRFQFTDECQTLQRSLCKYRLCGLCVPLFYMFITFVSLSWQINKVEGGHSPFSMFLLPNVKLFQLVKINEAQAITSMVEFRLRQIRRNVELRNFVTTSPDDAPHFWIENM